MDSQGIEALLSQLKATAAMAKQAPSTRESNSPKDSFATTLKSALDNVNQQEKTGDKLVEDVARGQNNVDISQVMVALQKADLSFQAMVEVRNKLVSAYQDIMNLQI